MEEKKVNDEVKLDAKDDKLVRIFVTDKVSIILPEKTTTGKDILSAVTALSGMFFIARNDKDYKKFAGRSLKKAIEFVTNGDYEKALAESKKLMDAKSKSGESKA